MNISIHSDRKDTHVAASLYVAATQIPGLHLVYPDEADLVINVDSVHNTGLVRGGKTAYYELDDNLHQGKNKTLYEVDLLYIVTKANLPLYPTRTKWLPVAMEPIIHYHWPFAESHDFVFIGQYNNPSYEFRKQVIEELSKKFDGILTHCQSQDYPKFLSQAKVRLNVNPRIEDKPPLIITRFYESMGIGFTMNDYHPTMDDIATEGKHYVGFSTAEDAIEKMKFYLSNEVKRIEIGKTGKWLMLNEHTWKHRLLSILEDYEKL
mgnify:CR=1 FL=1